MNRNLILVTISLFIWGFGEGLFYFFQPVYLESLGASPVIIGIIYSASGVALALSQIPAGRLSDRVGPRNIILASWFLGTVAAIVMAASPSLALFSIGWILYVMTGFVAAPLNSYINMVKGKWNIQRALTISSAGFNFGVVLGPITGGWIAEHYQIRFVYSIAAMTFFISTLIMHLIEKIDIQKQTHLQKGDGFIPSPRFIGLLVLFFFVFLSEYLSQPLTPTYLGDVHNLSIGQIGQLGSIASMGNVIIALVLGGLKGKIGFMLGQALVFCFALLMWKGNNIELFSFGYFLLGGYKLTRSMVLAIIRPFAPDNMIGFSFGMVETVNAVAVIIGPPLSGLIYGNSTAGMYMLVCAILLITIITSHFLIHIKPPVIIQEGKKL